jgi:hypothetical protein
MESDVNNGLNFFAQRRVKVMLSELRPAASTNPRDKVLALIGLSHDELRRIEFPAYQNTVSQLCCQVLAH